VEGLVVGIPRVGLDRFFVDGYPLCAGSSRWMVGMFRGYVTDYPIRRHCPLTGLTDPDTIGGVVVEEFHNSVHNSSIKREER
jgi:hypothetical protein